MDQTDNHSTSVRQCQRLIETGESAEARLGSPDDFKSIKLMDMPNEVLYMISGFLPQPWPTTLGLSCKFLSKITGRETQPRLQGADRFQFLTTLQKDMPNAYYCFCCGFLRRLDPSLDWKSQHHAKAAKAFTNSRWLPDMHNVVHFSLPKRLLWFMSRTNISFMEAYLAMDRHFLGPSNGLPLQSLERYEAVEGAIKLDRCRNPGGRRHHSARQYTDLAPFLNLRFKNPARLLEASPRKEDTWRFTFRMTAKVIDDKLYIGRAYTIIGPLVPEEDVERLIETTSIPICNHLTCTASPSCCNRMLGSTEEHSGCRHAIESRLECRWENGRFGRDIVPEAEQGSCLLCSTDYEVSVNRETSSKETIFKINTWHCLGSCRSPDDNFWTRFVSSHDDPSDWAATITFAPDDGSESPLHRYTPLLDPTRPSRDQSYKCLIPKAYLGAVRRQWHEAA